MTANPFYTLMTGNPFYTLMTGNLSSCRVRYQPVVAAEVRSEESSPCARFEKYLADLQLAGTWGDRTSLVRAMCACTMCLQAMRLNGEV